MTDLQEESQESQMRNTLVLRIPTEKLKKKVTYWKNDGVDGGPSSIDILLGWLTRSQNYRSWKGGSSSQGRSKEALVSEILEEMIEKQITWRTSKQIRSKIDELEAKYKKAIDWRGNTGAGLMEQGQGAVVRDYILKLCPEFDDLDPIMSDRASSRPAVLMGSETMTDISSSYDELIDTSSSPTTSSSSTTSSCSSSSTSTSSSSPSTSSPATEPASLLSPESRKRTAAEIRNDNSKRPRSLPRQTPEKSSLDRYLDAMTQKTNAQTNLQKTLQRAELALKIKELIEKGINPESIGLTKDEINSFGINLDLLL